MTQIFILSCRGAQQKYWQLGVLPPVAGQMTLIGWRLNPLSVEGGVPHSVAVLLAEALTAVTRVGFPSSLLDPFWRQKGTTLAEDDFVRSLGKGGWCDRINAVWRRIPAEIITVSTRHPLTMQTLFDDALYPWAQQGQVALFSAAETMPPELKRSDWLSLLGGDWAERVARLAIRFPSIAGALRPGVDGDVAGLFSLSSEFESAVLSALEERTRQAGMVWNPCPSEDIFSECMLATLSA